MKANKINPSEVGRLKNLRWLSSVVPLDYCKKAINSYKLILSEDG